MGIALAATAGFRVFVPLLVGAIAVRAGMIEPTESFMWLGSTTAIIIFATATIFEIIAYYIPFIDNLLDTLATPASIVAGILLTATFIGKSSELFRWTVAIIAGGGIAAIVQGATTFIRGGSTMATGGLANPIISTGELGASLVGSFLALFAPIIIIVSVIFLLIWVIKKLKNNKATNVRVS